ncbi:MAG TPA: S41 family peptidase, partial [Lachnospiraceae bacterium]|nr:S41 family peptidase [Lachnospiraceae bacterium]
FADGDKLFLLDETGKVTKSSLVSIDGIPVENIFNIVDKYFPSENETGLNFNHSLWSLYKPMLEFAGCDVSKDYIKVTIDDNGTLVEKRIEFTKKSYYDAYSYKTDIQSEVLDDIYYIDLNTCALDENKFNEENKKLKEAIDNGTSKVIIDVRNNGGGNAEYCKQLLKTLGMTAPEYGATFRRSPLASGLRGWTETSGIEREDINTNVVRNEKINLVVLTNEYTFSAATMLGVFVQDGKLGTIIRRPSINAPSCFSDVVQYETKNSKTPISISYLKLDRPDTKADPDTLIPDMVTEVGKDSLEQAIVYLNSK